MYVHIQILKHINLLGLNVAVSGAESKDIEDQARTLVNQTM